MEKRFQFKAVMVALGSQMTAQSEDCSQTV